MLSLCIITINLILLQYIDNTHHKSIKDETYHKNIREDKEIYLIVGQEFIRHFFNKQSL